MKKSLLLLLCNLCVILGNAQEITVNTSMGTSYADQVYYKLSSQVENAYAANSWDISFLRISAYAFGIRSNDALGIQVFQVANTADQWNAIDISNQSSWVELRNSETNWDEGAFQQGTATYGWGEYNVSNHHIEGTIIFVIKLEDGSYYKFINEDFYSGYTFKYAKWNTTTNSWETDQRITIPNTSNTSNRYNYYSLRNNQDVVAEAPMTDWDFVLRRYVAELSPGVFYTVTGALHHPSLTIAEYDDDGGQLDPNSLNYVEDINVIGYNWKSFTGASYTVDMNKKFFIKYEDGTIYKLYFTEFEGSSTGNITFKYEDVTTTLDVKEVDEKTAFGIYPNPTKDKKITMLFDVQDTNKGIVSILTSNGQIAYQENIGYEKGFFQKEIDLAHLSTGIYILRYTSDQGKNITKKIILE